MWPKNADRHVKQERRKKRKLWSTPYCVIGLLNQTKFCFVVPLSPTFFSRVPVLKLTSFSPFSSCGCVWEKKFSIFVLLPFPPSLPHPLNFPLLPAGNFLTYFFIRKLNFSFRSLSSLPPPLLCLTFTWGVSPAGEGTSTGRPRRGRTQACLPHIKIQRLFLKENSRLPALFLFKCHKHFFGLVLLFRYTLLLPVCTLSLLLLLLLLLRARHFFLWAPSSKCGKTDRGKSSKRRGKGRGGDWPKATAWARRRREVEFFLTFLTAFSFPDAACFSLLFSRGKKSLKIARFTDSQKWGATN